MITRRRSAAAGDGASRAGGGICCGVYLMRRDGHAVVKELHARAVGPAVACFVLLNVALHLLPSRSTIGFVSASSAPA